MSRTEPEPPRQSKQASKQASIVVRGPLSLSFPDPPALPFLPTPRSAPLPPQVMPVLIPSSFRPGPARTTVRIPVGEQGGVAAWRASDGAASLLFKAKGGGGGQGDRGLRGGGGGDGEAGRRRGGGEEADQSLEDLDSLRQSLLGVEDGVGQEDEGVGPGEADDSRLGGR